MTHQAYTDHSGPRRAFTVKQYAEAKNLSVRTVWRMIAANKLKAERYSARCVRIVEEQPVAA